MTFHNISISQKQKHYFCQKIPNPVKLHYERLLEKSSTEEQEQWTSWNKYCTYAYRHIYHPLIHLSLWYILLFSNLKLCYKWNFSLSFFVKRLLYLDITAFLPNISHIRKLKFTAIYSKPFRWPRVTFLGFLRIMFGSTFVHW